MKINAPGIMLAGTNSGCGKTTVTCAVLRALMNKGLNVAAFKCGPDYIDPMFHTRVVGVPSRNIDFFLCGENRAKLLFANNSRGADISVIEGVMGFYDGMGGSSHENSSCHTANSLGVPVVLVVDCRGASLSAAAVVKGFKDFLPNTISAVILNNVSAAMYGMYKQLLQEHTGLKVLGHMPKEPLAALESRHLGLVTADEVKDLNEKINRLAKLAEKTVDLEGLIQLASTASPIDWQEREKQESEIRVAIARDKAFCFYYSDMLELLESCGVKLVPFSPLEDKSLPQNINGLIIGGGYPELYTRELSQNKTMCESIRLAAKNKMPIYAECGGFMYLGQKIDNEEMCGVIKMESFMTSRLQNFGYARLTALQDNMLMKKGDSVNAHEFHYSSSTVEGGDLKAEKQSGKTWLAGYCKDNIFALYPHLHMDEKMARSFALQCKKYNGGA